MSKILTGIAGEFFVAAELSRRGYIASLTLRNTKGIDILASNQDATKSVGIQVKANKGSNTKWLLSQKAERDIADHLCYLFVNLNETAPPTYYIVPRKVVADYVRETHANWLKTPGKTGAPHQDTTMRVFEDPDPKYRDAWHLLALD